MGDSPRRGARGRIPSVIRMLTLTQIYAEAWSQLDPAVADEVVSAVPTPRQPDSEQLAPMREDGASDDGTRAAGG